MEARRRARRAARRRALRRWRPLRSRRGANGPMFNGLATTERLNLLWLHGFRRRPAWMPRYASLIRGLARGGDTALGDLFAHDDGSGELKSVVWHLVWSGQLDIDLASPITEQSRVVVNEELWNV